ncbi:MAG: Asp-tRNA(Asn)/Glu-tRNA(Gln) amidotransferase subunit GatC [Candidatus Omnitrophica bacterium]|nr:Asp-tRNA(Asn)/Glu-tRNA(Gln) amidotransferase subunit GatC [Candidatus Omnitrophota bacterium]
MVKSKSNSITIKTVNYIANLARIELKEKELKIFVKQLKKIIDYINKLKELDVSDIPPSSHILKLKNVLREDNLKESLPIKEVLKNAPEKKENFFVVPKIIE